MRPSDHPEYYRLPPPPGRSRESTIVLTADGRFLHDGEPVTHAGMQRAFASWLKRHPGDGRYVLDNGHDWTYLMVEGAARFVAAVRERAGVPEVELLDGRSMPLSPELLRLREGDDALWLELLEGEPARFTRSAQLELSPWLEDRGEGPGIAIGSQFWPIARAGAGP
jgi:hypothetical protein